MSDEAVPVVLDDPKALIWLEFRHYKDNGCEIDNVEIMGPFTNDEYGRHEVDSKIEHAHTVHGQTVHPIDRERILWNLFTEEEDTKLYKNDDDEKLFVIIRGVLESDKEDVADAVRSSKSSAVRVYTVRHPVLDTPRPVRLRTDRSKHPNPFDEEMYEVVSPFVAQKGEYSDLGFEVETFLHKEDAFVHAWDEAERLRPKDHESSDESDDADDSHPRTKFAQKGELLQYLNARPPRNLYHEEEEEARRAYEDSDNDESKQQIGFVADVSKTNRLKSLITVTEVTVLGGRRMYPKTFFSSTGEDDEDSRSEFSK